MFIIRYIIKRTLHIINTLTISSGANIPNCTRFTLRSGALESKNAIFAAATTVHSSLLPVFLRLHHMTTQVKGENNITYVSWPSWLCDIVIKLSQTVI
jgi:hypothetical protein